MIRRCLVFHYTLTYEIHKKKFSSVGRVHLAESMARNRGNDSSAKNSLQYLRHIMNSVDDPALPRVPLHINL